MLIHNIVDCFEKEIQIKPCQIHVGSYIDLFNSILLLDYYI